MEHYITLFDSLFLPQGLALCRSMERHVDDYTLWVLCMDGATYALLNKLNLPNVRLIALDEVETEQLLALKAERKVNEYCWTLTPMTQRFVFERDETARRVTYLDADVWFMSSPKRIFEELEQAKKSVLITDHAYSPECDETEASGQYCVQFMCFYREDGENVRQWWEDRCIEWCYDRSEDGKFGDQKYLDDWPTRFAEDVHVLQNPQWTLAPWNALRFPIDDGVIWHFQALRLQLRGGRFFADFGSYKLPARTRAEVYAPYLEDLGAAIDLMQAHGVAARPQASPRFKRLVKGLFAQTGGWLNTSS